MKCGRTVEELEEEITRLRSLWSGDMTAVIQLQKRVTELEAGLRAIVDRHQADVDVNACCGCEDCEQAKALLGDS